MQEKNFRDYLLNQYRGHGGHPLNINTTNSRISNCKRIELYEENLDRLFEDDQLADLLARLRYTKADERSGQPLRHKIPIEGNRHNGTATLKSAVDLYRQFRLWQADGKPVSTTAKPPDVKLKASNTDWPKWALPSSDEELALAKIITRYARFLQPEIIRKLVVDNEQNRDEWTHRLGQRSINHRFYLWPYSSCAFPGIRRYSGSKEIAIFRKQIPGDINDALALDDNDYPKHLWSFVLTGKKFQKHGPHGYALAHLADHKNRSARIADEFICSDENIEIGIQGLFTAPTNTCYTPTAMLRPTDFSHTIRNLLIRRATDLYESVCKLWPPQLSIRGPVKTGWELDQFEWADPVGDVARTVDFLEFRREVMERLFQGT